MQRKKEANGLKSYIIAHAKQINFVKVVLKNNVENHKSIQEKREPVTDMMIYMNIL